MYRCSMTVTSKLEIIAFGCLNAKNNLILISHANPTESFLKFHLSTNLR